MVAEEMLHLFGYGLVFRAAFRMTGNVAVPWPFYMPVGGLYATLSDGLTMPFDATYGFLLTLRMMITAITVTHMLYEGKTNPHSWTGSTGGCSSPAALLPFSAPTSFLLSIYAALLQPLRQVQRPGWRGLAVPLERSGQQHSRG
jgi:hypothetical protein